MRGLATPGVKDKDELARCFNWIQMTRFIFSFGTASRRPLDFVLHILIVGNFFTTKGLYLVLPVSCLMLISVLKTFIQLKGGQGWTRWRWGAPRSWHCRAEVETFFYFYEVENILIPTRKKPKRFPRASGENLFSGIGWRKVPTCRKSEQMMLSWLSSFGALIEMLIIFYIISMLIIFHITYFEILIFCWSFLRGCKFSLERSKEKLDFHFTVGFSKSNHPS